MCSTNKVYQAWKESAARREAQAYREAIRAHDLKLVRKAQEDEEQASYLRQYDAKRQEAMMQSLHLTQEEAKAVDKMLTVAVQGLTVAVVLLSGLIVYSQWYKITCWLIG